MGRVCMGRVGYGPSLSWAEFVMGRDVQLPSLFVKTRTQNDPDLRLKKMFKYVVSARFLVSFKILWSFKRCLDDK